MNKVFTSLAAAALLCIQCVHAQNRTIKGKVTSQQDGQTVPGASVLIKGTTIGTLTDIDGNYSLSVPDTAKTLVISSVGLKKKEVSIGASSDIDVMLDADILKLDEVVVTANAINREKRSLGYGVSTVGSDELNRAQEKSVINALQGKVAGVQITSSSGGVGSSSRIRIREGSSVLLDNRPLMVVDGIPINDDMVQTGDELNRQIDAGNRANDINPEDIESVTILKGPAAAALYGSRASNGAVVITTKKGKSKNVSGKSTSISLSTGYTWETPLMLPEFQNQFGQGLPFLPHDNRENTSWGAPFDGVVRPWGWEVDGQQRVKPYEALPDNVKEFFDIGHTFTKNLSLGGGSDKSTYYFSVGNVKQNGIIPGTTYDRTNIKVSGGTELANHFRSNASVMYAKSKGDLSIQGQQTALSPWENLIQTPRDISLLELQDLDNPFNTNDNFYSPYTSNPWWTLEKNKYTSDVDHVIGNVLLGYSPFEWIDIDYRAGADHYVDNREEKHAIVTLSEASPNHLEAAPDYPGFYETTGITSTEVNSDLMVTLKKNLTPNLRASLLLGHNVNHNQNYKVVSTARQLVVPYLYNLTNVNGNVESNNQLTQKRLWGAYFDINLAWKNFLFFEVTGRNDHSSTLPEESNSYFYPSANISLVFSDLLKSNPKFFSYGKFMISYAKVGKDAPPYSIDEIYAAPVYSDPVYQITDGHANSYINFPFNGISGFTKGNTVGNDKLTPEFTTALEFGLDLAFINDRIGITFNYYNNESKDQIIPITLPASTGYTSQFVNAATMTNKGIELMLKLTPVSTRNFKWDLAVNYSKNTNEVVSLYQGVNELSIGNGTAFVGADVVAAVGKPWGQFKVTSFQYDPEGHVVVDPSTGYPILNPNDQIIGSFLPDYTAGLTNTVIYKNIALSFTFDMKEGGLIFSRTKSTMTFAGTDPRTTYNDREPFVVPNSVIQNPDGSYSANEIEVDPFTYWCNSANAVTNVPSENFIDGSYTKLREVSLSYSFPKKWLSKTFLGDASLAFIGRNLWISTHEDNTYIDPEVSSFGTGNVQGYDYGALPSIRTYGGALRFTF